MQPEQLKTVVESVLWATKHQEPGIAEIGLDTLSSLLKGLAANREGLSQFLAIYLMPICREIFVVLTDSLHKAGFKLQTEILMGLITVVKNREISVPISPDCPDNLQYVQQFLLSALAASFPHLAKATITQFVEALFMNCGTWETFKTTVRDFLINLKEFAGDTEALYSEERLVSPPSHPRSSSRPRPVVSSSSTKTPSSPSTTPRPPNPTSLSPLNAY